MVNSCCAVGCVNRYAKNAGLSFHTFPLDEKRRALWTLALKRKDWEPTRYSVICGKHFQTGKPNLDEHHPDYVPNVFSFSKGKIKSAKSYEMRKIRHQRILKQREGKPSSDPENPDYVPNVFVFKKPVKKRLKQLRKALNEDPKKENNIKIEDESTNSEPLPACEVIIQEQADLIMKGFSMKTEPEERTDSVQEDNEPIDSEATESACESSRVEDDDFYFLKLELYEAYTDLNALKNEKEVILKELCLSHAERKNLQDSVSEKDRELSKVKNELLQAYKEVNALRIEKEALQKKVACSDLTNRILQDAKELFFYTGVHSTKDFHSILSLVYDVDTSVKLFPMATQLLIVLMRLKHNLVPLDLAFRFQTSRNTVQRMCASLIPCLEEKLELIVRGPETLRSNLPPCSKSIALESLYFRIKRFVKAEVSKNENKETDCEKDCEESM